MARSKKQTINGGIPKPNCFVVPTAILSIIPSMDKAEIHCLLYALAMLLDPDLKPYKDMENDLQRLQRLGILNEEMEFVMRSDPVDIKLVKQVDRYQYKNIKEVSADPAELIKELPHGEELWNCYKNFLLSKKRGITNAIMLSWVNSIIVLSKREHFQEAARIAVNAGVGAPKYIEAIIDRKSKVQSTEEFSWDEDNEA